jgi:hypothetical protein
MIEVVAHEKFYKDVAHEMLRPVVPKDPTMAHTCTTLNGGASSSSTNSGILKMF